MADMIKFFKGQLANLPEVGASGALYVTSDEGAIYLGTGTGMKRLGDFIQVANVASLPSGGANESALYYCVAENILAKWNGSSWSQINKDTGMTAVEVVGEGNAVTAAEYSADGRKLTLTKGATYATPGVVDSKISTAVGELGNDGDGNAYANVKAYVDAKTSGIATDAALGELQDRVATAEGEIDALQAAIGENGSVTGDIADAKQAAVDAQAAADKAQGEIDELETVVSEYKTANDAAVAAAKSQADKGVADAATAQEKANAAYELAESKATMDEVNTAIAGAGHAVKSEVDQAIADLDAAYKAADTALETKLQGNIDKKVEQSVYDAKIAELEGADTTLQGNIDAEAKTREDADKAQVERIAALEGQIVGLTGAMHFKGVKDALPEDVTGYENGDVIIVGDKEYVFNTDKFVEFGDVSAEGERISALENVVGDAEGGLVKDVADNAAAIATEKSRAEGKEAELAAADTANLAEAKKYTDDEIAELNISQYAKQSDLDAHTGDTVIHITAEERAAWNAAEGNAKDHADGLNTAMNTRVEALEAIDHDHDNKTVLDGITAEKVAAWDGAQAAAEATAAAALAAAKTEISAEIDADVKVVNDAFVAYKDANDAAVALKANASDVYTKTETFTKEEVNAAIAAAIETAHTWGEF